MPTSRRQLPKKQTIGNCMPTSRRQLPKKQTSGNCTPTSRGQLPKKTNLNTQIFIVCIMRQVAYNKNIDGNQPIKTSSKSNQPIKTSSKSNQPIKTSSKSNQPIKTSSKSSNWLKLKLVLASSLTKVPSQSPAISHQNNIKLSNSHGIDSM